VSSKLPRYYYGIIINTWLGFIYYYKNTQTPWKEGWPAGWLAGLLGGLNSYHPIAMGTLISLLAREKSKHVGLAQQNSFGLAFLQSSSSTVFVWWVVLEITKLYLHTLDCSLQSTTLLDTSRPTTQLASRCLISQILLEWVNLTWLQFGGSNQYRPPVLLKTLSYPLSYW
jgi:hypothetical protein